MSDWPEQDLIRAEEYLAARDEVERGRPAYYNRGEPGTPLPTMVLETPADLERVFPREVREFAARILRGRQAGSARDSW